MYGLTPCSTLCRIQHVLQGSEEPISSYTQPRVEPRRYKIHKQYLPHIRLGHQLMQVECHLTFNLVPHSTYPYKWLVAFNTFIPGRARPHSDSAYDTVSCIWTRSSPLSPSSCVQHMSTNDLSSQSNDTFPRLRTSTCRARRSNTSHSTQGRVLAQPALCLQRILHGFQLAI